MQIPVKAIITIKNGSITDAQYLMCKFNLNLQRVDRICSMTHYDLQADIDSQKQNLLKEVSIIKKENEKDRPNSTQAVFANEKDL